MSNSSVPKIDRKGLLLVLSSPSGAGKTTLSRALLDGDKAIELSISVTTRKPRGGEINGKDYIFVNEDTFSQMRSKGELLEWASVFGNSYGTQRKPVEEAIAKGKDVLFDIDWQGAQQLSEKMAGNLVRVFILPPSASILASRLKGRGLDSFDVITKRMEEASSEISHWPEYDYVIVNEDLKESLVKLKSILAAERLRRHRLIGLTEFVRNLQKDL
ncbi:MAG: guanylate kinase [Hyphomicrobium sp.]